MPNLNLTHSGNMSITSAEITSAGTLNVQYGQNTTGNITGWTHNQSAPLVCGETYTITLIPQFSGTVLTENFVVSGDDIAGVQRSDTSILRQRFDSNLLHYDVDPRSNPTTIQINSSSVTETYLEVNATVLGHSSDTVGFYIDHSNDGAVESNFVRFDVVDPTEPDTGGVISSLNIVVADAITGSGRASATYTPSSAYVDLVYSSSDTSKATINAGTGAITVLESGNVTFCVEDNISGLRSCKTVTVYKSGDEPGPDTGDTGIVINFIAISVPAYIVNTGTAYTQFSPSNAAVDLHYSSLLPSIASIDERTGVITVHNTGNVTFCVIDSRSGLSDCMSANVTRSAPDPTIYATAITLNVASAITDTGVATATVEPENAVTSLYYTSLNPEYAEIDRYTGQIIVRRSGTVTFCVEERIKSLSDCKTVEVIKTEPPVTGGTDTYWFSVTYDVYFNYQNSVSIPIAGAAEWAEMQYGNIMAFTENGRMLSMDIPFSDEWGPLVGTTFYKDQDAPDGPVDSACPITVYYVSSGDSTSNFVGYIPDYFTHRGGETGYNLTVSNNFKRIGEFCGLVPTGDFYIPSGCIVGPQEYWGYPPYDHTLLTSVTIPGPMYYNSGQTRYVDNGALWVPRYVAGTDEKAFDVLVPSGYVQSYLDYYNANINRVMEHPWEGWVSPITGSTPTPDFEIHYVTAMTISGNDSVTDLDWFTYSFSPANAFRDIHWHSSDPTTATIDENGFVKVLRNGTVSIYVEDTVSGLITSKTISVHKSSSTTTGRLAATYRVEDSSVEVPIIKYNSNRVYSYEITDYVAKAELLDGTEIDLTNVSGYNVVYQFDSVGEHTVYYTLLPGVTELDEMFDSITDLTSLELPYGVVMIDKFFAAGCENLQYVSFPSTLRYIGEAAFRTTGCEYIILPNNLRAIGTSAFYTNDTDRSLRELIIPSSVERIGSGAFVNNTGLTSITLTSTVPPVLETYNGGPFNYTGNCPIYVPCEAVNTYKSADVWSMYSSRIQCKEQPDVVATSITLNVPASITNTGQATGTFAPANAHTNLFYSITPGSVAGIDLYTGEITAYKTGTAHISVVDLVSGLDDSKQLQVYRGFDELEIVVDDVITNSGQISCTYSPDYASKNLTYGTTDDGTNATVTSGGSITVNTNVPSGATITVYVEDSISGLRRTKDITVRRRITSLYLNVADTINNTGQATCSYVSSTAPVDIYYSLTGSAATINSSTGLINVISNGNVTVTVTDILSGLQDSKTIFTLITLDARYTAKYNVTTTGNTFLYSTTYSNMTPFSQAELEGYGEITPTDDGYGRWYFAFPTTGVQTLYLTEAEPGEFAGSVNFSASTQLVEFIYPEHHRYAESIAFSPTAGNSNCGVTAITFPNEMDELPNMRKCRYLESVTLPDTVTRKGNASFMDCTALTGITIPDSYDFLPSFSGCTALTGITIPSGVTEIEASAFKGCRSLQSITIPSGVTTVGSGVFSGCTAMTEATVYGATGDYMFYGCKSLTGITFGVGVTKIANRMLQGTTSLQRITSYATVAPTLVYGQLSGGSYSWNSFYGIKTGGTLYYPAGSDYSYWLDNRPYNLGYYNWLSSPTL